MEVEEVHCSQQVIAESFTIKRTIQAFIYFTGLSYTTNSWQTMQPRKNRLPPCAWLLVANGDVIMHDWVSTGSTASHLNPFC